MDVLGCAVHTPDLRTGLCVGCSDLLTPPPNHPDREDIETQALALCAICMPGADRVSAMATVNAERPPACRCHCRFG
jgi:hypothetical protein